MLGGLELILNFLGHKFMHYTLEHSPRHEKKSRTIVDKQIQKTRNHRPKKVTIKLWGVTSSDVPKLRPTLHQHVDPTAFQKRPKAVVFNLCRSLEMKGTHGTFFWGI